MVLIGRLVVLLFSLSFSVVAIINTSKLDMFDSTGLPSARFWPIVCSVIVLILTALNVAELIPQVKTIDKTINPKELKRTGIFYVLLFVCAVFLSNILGFFTSMAAFLFVSLLLWNKLSWKTCLPVSIGLPAVMWVLCALILKMAQFPKGILM